MIAPIFRISFCVLLLCAFYAPWSTEAEAKKGDTNKDGVLAARIQKLISQSKLKKDDFGIAIGSGATAGPIAAVNINSRELMIPASITKLVTGAAVIDELPPGTKVKTQLLSKASGSGGVLKGDLCLKGGGDPGFISESMWYLVNAFLRTGIRDIQGDLLVDESLFDDSHFDMSRQKQRVDRAYDAPVSALSFNWNSVNVFVRPGPSVGSPAEIFLDPENEYTKLKGRILTAAAGNGQTASAERVNGNEGDVIEVGGKISLGHPEVVIYKSISNPPIWAGKQLKEFFSQRNVKISGQVKKAVCDSEFSVLAEVESEPIERMLADMNKFSNNYVAEMLTKMLGSLEEKPGSIAGGMKKIEKFLKGLGVPSAEMSLVNPSGLTRENKMSAAALLKVLEHLQQDFRLMPEMFVSLPIAGVDGTLKRRLKGTPGERFVRAKTGYLSGIISLAGFAGNSEGRVLPFVFIYNGGGDENKVRSVFDQIALMLVENGG